jgi:hypothetical protein
MTGVSPVCAAASYSDAFLQCCSCKPVPYAIQDTHVLQKHASCIADEAAAGMGATLVVVPSVIAGQWMTEMNDHSNLTVLHYTGLARHDRQG